MLRTLRFLALLLAALLGAVWAYAWVTRAPGEGLAEAFGARIATVFGAGPPGAAGGGLQLAQGLSMGGPFSLVDETGTAVTERDFAGRWMLVYFGYSYCPDVCPTELGTMATVVDALGPLADRIVPVFVSVDPDRDTPAQLADYVSRFHPRMRGLTGSPAQVADVARGYRVYYAKTKRPEMTDYVMDHSSLIYLVGPDARVRALFRPGQRPEEMTATIAAQLGVAAGGKG